jgi:RNA polymerase sigma-70 factor, ECF subfamily
MSPVDKLHGLKGVDLSSSKDERISRENAWVRGINQGDAKAFEAMYKYYYPRLGQYLVRFVYSQKTAEDLMHNLFYNIWENREKLEPRGTLRAYLYTAARNQALKYIDKDKNRSHVSLDDHLKLHGKENRSEETIEYKEFSQAVKIAVSQLPNRRKQIFLLHREDKLTYREIAETLNISIKTVETQMSRSLKFLGEKLAEFRIK